MTKCVLWVIESAHTRPTVSDEIFTESTAQRTICGLLRRVDIYLLCNCLFWIIRCNALRDSGSSAGRIFAASLCESPQLSQGIFQLLAEVDRSIHMLKGKI